jgi:hypothetical protein
MPACDHVEDRSGKRQAAGPTHNPIAQRSALWGFVELMKVEELIRPLPTHLRPYATFLCHCCGHSGEATLIEWSQVDLGRRLIRLEHDQIKHDQTKHDDDRSVPLPSLLVMMLTEPERKEKRLFDTAKLRKEWRGRLRRVRIGP